MVLLERAADQSASSHQQPAPSPERGRERHGAAPPAQHRDPLKPGGGVGVLEDDERLAWEIHMAEVNALSAQGEVRQRVSKPVQMT